MTFNNTLIYVYVSKLYWWLRSV